MTATPFHQRAGLTLLEVVFAMAIFLLSVVAIWQLALFGNERALDVMLQTRTSLRCQAKLAEVTIGAQSMDASGGYSSFDDEKDKDLQWRMEVAEAEAAGLMNVKVWVKAELPGGRIVESHLSQLVLDPSIRGTTFDQPEAMTPPGTAPKDSSTADAGAGTGGAAATGGGTGAGMGGAKSGAKGGAGGAKGGAGGAKTGGAKTGGTGGAKTGGTGGAKTGGTGGPGIGGTRGTGTGGTGTGRTGGAGMGTGGKGG